MPKCWRSETVGVRRERNRGFQGLIRWHAKCIKFCRHFNSNMLDSWVSPEAAGFFISFTEGQSPLLPAPLPLSAVSLSFLVLFSLCHHPSLSLSYFFGALSPSLLLCAYKIIDHAFVSFPMSGNLHSLWSPHTEMGMLGLSPLFSALCFGENMFSSHHSPNISALPLLFYFILFL